MQRVILTGLFTLLASFPLSEVASAQEESDWVVVFVSMRSGDGDLYAVDPDSQEEWKVYGTDQPEGAPRVDAFRKRIVHHRFDGPDGAPRLFARKEFLFDDPNGEVAPSWSPDGERILYAANRADQIDLYTAAADGTNEQRLTRTVAEEKYPAYSPDGSMVAWLERVEGGWNVMTTVAGSADKPSVVLTLERYAGHLVWSPDGQWLAVDAMIEFDSDIVLVDLSDPSASIVIRREGNDLIPAFSPDGQTVVFASSDEEGNWDVWSYNRDTEAFKRLTTDPSFDGGPVVVPRAWLSKMP